MTLANVIPASTSVLLQLVNPAVRSLALAGAAGLVLAAFRVKSTTFRLFTWSAVLYVALVMPFLGRVLPPLSIPAPAFLQHAQSGPTMPATSHANLATEHSGRAEISPSPETTNMSSAAKATQPSAHSVVMTAPASAPRWSPLPSSISWSLALTVIYLAVALTLLARMLVGLILARRLLRASHRIDDPRVTKNLASRAHACGLAFIPPAKESELISVPVTMGALGSTILLPAEWREWNGAQLDAVIAHEVSHVARHDALTQRLSLLHRAIFWFSPLAWWLDRQLADLAEQASDEAALSCGADRNDYASTLLGFFEALQAAPGRVWWQGVAMAKTGQAELRVERILAWKGTVTMTLKKSLAVAIVVLAIPVVYVAASVSLVSHNERTQTPEPAQVETPQPELSVAPAAPVSTPRAHPVIAPAAAVPASQSHPAMPFVARVAQAEASKSAHNHRFSYAYGFDDEQRFVMVSGNSDSFTMSGTGEDARHAEKLKKQIAGDFIWFQRDEKSYIIRDQATVDRARKLWAPQEELGKQQEELGAQQEELGKQQEALSSTMEEVHVKVPDMTAELDRLREKLKKLGAGATMDQIGEIQSEIGELQSKLGEIQSQAGEQQSKVGEQMGALGEKQGKLGEKQGELGRKQSELAQRAAREMKELLDEALAKGTAQPEP